MRRSTRLPTDDSPLPRRRLSRRRLRHARRLGAGRAGAVVPRPRRPGRRCASGVGEAGNLAGVAVRFDEVVEDSRCPEGVTCVWEGRAKARLDVAGTPVVLTAPHGGDRDRRRAAVGRARRRADSRRRARSVSRERGASRRASRSSSCSSPIRSRRASAPSGWRSHGRDALVRSGGRGATATPVAWSIRSTPMRARCSCSSPLRRRLGADARRGARWGHGRRAGRVRDGSGRRARRTAPRPTTRDGPRSRRARPGRPIVEARVVGYETARVASTPDARHGPGRARAPCAPGRPAVGRRVGRRVRLGRRRARAERARRGDDAGRCGRPVSGDPDVSRRHVGRRRRRTVRARRRRVRDRRPARRRASAAAVPVRVAAGRRAVGRVAVSGARHALLDRRLLGALRRRALGRARARLARRTVRARHRRSTSASPASAPAPTCPFGPAACASRRRARSPTRCSGSTAAAATSRPRLGRRPAASSPSFRSEAPRASKLVATGNADRVGVRVDSPGSADVFDGRSRDVLALVQLTDVQRGWSVSATASHARRVVDAAPGCAPVASGVVHLWPSARRPSARSRRASGSSLAPRPSARRPPSAATCPTGDVTGAEARTVAFDLGEHRCAPRRLGRGRGQAVAPRRGDAGRAGRSSHRARTDGARPARERVRRARPHTRLRLAAGLYSQAPDLSVVALDETARLGVQRARHLVGGVLHERGALTLRAEAYAKTYRGLALHRGATVLGGDGTGLARGLDLFARVGSVEASRCERVGLVLAARHAPDAGRPRRRRLPVRARAASVRRRARVRRRRQGALRAALGRLGSRTRRGRPAGDGRRARGRRWTACCIPVDGTPGAETLPAFARLDASVSYTVPLGRVGRARALRRDRQPARPRQRRRLRLLGRLRRALAQPLPLSPVGLRRPHVPLFLTPMRLSFLLLLTTASASAQTDALVASAQRTIIANAEAPDSLLVGSRPAPDRRRRRPGPRTTPRSPTTGSPTCSGRPTPSAPRSTPRRGAQALATWPQTARFRTTCAPRRARSTRPCSAPASGSIRRSR